MRNKEQKLKYIDFLKKGKKTKQPKVNSSQGEEYKYPITHMNELIVTPNGTELGSVTSDAMLDNLVTTYMQRQAKDKRDLSNMVRHIHSGTETAAKWLAPLVIAPVAATLPWGTVGRGAAKGLEFLGKAMTPSSYLGTGTYTTALGGTNASLSGALADAGLAGYYGVEAYNALKDNPNLQTVTNTALATIPAVGLVKSPLIKIPKGYTFLREQELRSAGGLRKVHLVKEESTGKIKVLEDLIKVSENKPKYVDLSKYHGEPLTGNEPGFDEWARKLVAEEDHFPDLSHGLTDVKEFWSIMNREFESLPNGSKIELGHIFSSDSSSNVLQFARRNKSRNNKCCCCRLRYRII